jgi:3-methylfumaryl-CoA hydratase
MDNLREWVGRIETVHDDMAVSQAQAAAATFNESVAAFAAGAELPVPWHWFYFLPRAPQPDLDDDGHPKRGGFLPPVPYPRRMFAGSRLSVRQPLRLGAPATREGVIRDVQLKSGKSGNLAFVTVGYRFTQGGALCLEEEQDIVYREPGAPVPPPVPAPWPATPSDAWTREVTPDARLLFRFSALTFNAHRIHYDRPYARDVEGYPGLIVHGPLTATLLAQLVRQQQTRPIAAFSFRGVAPLFDLAPYRLVGRADGDTVALEAQGPDGRVALQATATLG